MVMGGGAIVTKKGGLKFRKQGKKSEYLYCPFLDPTPFGRSDPIFDSPYVIFFWVHTHEEKKHLHSVEAEEKKTVQI